MVDMDKSPSGQENGSIVLNPRDTDSRTPRAMVTGAYPLREGKARRDPR